MLARSSIYITLTIFIHTPTALYIMHMTFNLQVASHLKTVYSQQQKDKDKETSQQPFLGPSVTPTRGSGPVRRTVITRVFEAVRAIALCHNVTPVFEDQSNGNSSYDTEADQQGQQKVVYQASSPDEVNFVFDIYPIQKYFIKDNIYILSNQNLFGFARFQQTLYILYKSVYSPN